jgi:hypothetical protein
VFFDHDRHFAPDPADRTRIRVGEVNGHLTVVGQAASDRYRTRWLCTCSRCGGTTILGARTLTAGRQSTCGCGPHGHAPGGGPIYRRTTIK